MEVLEQYIPLTHTVLNTSYKAYARPNDKISYLIEKGQLIPISKGKYVTKNASMQNQFLSHQIANILYGPSYISKYSALTYYGLLAETTTVFESMTINRSKTIKNKLGTYIYNTQPNKITFSIGVESKNINSNCTILIATPEKAICDIIWTTPSLILNTINDIEYFLEEDMRMEIDVLKNARIVDVENCIQHGKKKKELNLFLSLLKKMK